MACDASKVLAALQQRALGTHEPEELGRALVESLAEAYAQASWVGIYWLRAGELVLGPYVGPPTPHDRIPVGRGVCGTAVAEDRDIVVEDVREVGNYLACSPSVRSEIVVLIRSMGAVVGQIDMDAERVAAFGSVDQCILRVVADAFGGLLAFAAEREEAAPGAPPPGGPPGATPGGADLPGASAPGADARPPGSGGAGA